MSQLTRTKSVERILAKKKQLDLCNVDIVITRTMAATETDQAVFFPPPKKMTRHFFSATDICRVRAINASSSWQCMY